MKRKILVTIWSIIMGLSIVACGKQETTATTESVTATVESTQAETTETSEATTETTESVETTENTDSTTDTEVETTENTEEVEETIEATDIEKGEPLSEKDLAFPVQGYKSYNEYVEAGNTYSVLMTANATSEDLESNNTFIDSTVRGIKLGDSIDKVFELYGNTEEHSADIKNEFSHDGLKDSGAYNYFLKLDSTKEYFYAFRFRVDQNNNIIAVVIEPIPMEYWS